MPPDMTARLGPLTLKNPVLVASGAFGFGEEYAELVDLSRLGGVMVKGTTLRPRDGNPPPRVTETPAGMLNAIGLQNPGIDAVIEQKLPFLAQFDTAIIVNISGESIEEYVELARRLEETAGAWADAMRSRPYGRTALLEDNASRVLTGSAGETPAPRVDAIEINVSCPNVKIGGMQFGIDPALTRDLVAAVREVTNLPLITKLSPNVTDIVQMARAAVEGGTDILSLINTLLGMSIDVARRRPVLSNVTGGLSGPAIRPVAVRMVWQVAQELDTPIIGMGGIMTARDALEFILAGASAVAVGTANFVDPQASIRVLDGMEAHCNEEGAASISGYIGVAHRRNSAP